MAPDAMISDQSTVLAHEVNESVQMMNRALSEAADRLDVNPDHQFAEGVGREAWRTCDALLKVLLSAEPAEDWAEMTEIVQNLKDTAREWVDFALENQAKTASHSQI